MNYLALGLFCLWVLTEVLSAQGAVKPVVSVAGVSVSENFADRLVEAALYRTTQKVRYDPAYVALDYPGGDVPADTGVCTDVVIRSYRALGIDLQPLVHEDMKASFSAYPKLWGLKRPDKNIDHRRVPNLETFFKRHGGRVKEGEGTYLPGDLITWDLDGNGLWHIGIVVGPDTFVHNIGAGPVLETGLRQWKVVGHYRYHPR
ncbi:MAG: DUF1287 domain-containing protein [Verrucomicrobiales bacterium]|jgi:uncharacterized protein|nr:DUF1287 domain-containing protein [Verrucomicrobiales bacterium]MDP4791861.1 DUF1287 domain-containing protein [Verrucomicrobiales bacterium]MDP4939933.1 DUF1287 domain-containing protein [Verrucomicrobiales bacterium]MDP5007157.1 DUF1287 domain-containing protein [Verrucomicrobiales bacterium]